MEEMVVTAVMVGLVLHLEMVAVVAAVTRLVKMVK
jgi:hypothetical protein